MRLSRAAAWYLIVQSIGASLWWCVLMIWPLTRVLFIAPGAPDSVLLAFALPDAILFVGFGAAAAFGIWKERTWAWPFLCVHAGAAGYAALYCITLAVLTNGECWLGAILMSPPLAITAWMAWTLRPKESISCSMP